MNEYECSSDTSTQTQRDAPIHIHFTPTSSFSPHRLEPYLKEAVREFVLKYEADYGRDEKEQQREFYVAIHSLPTIQRWES